MILPQSVLHSRLVLHTAPAIEPVDFLHGLKDHLRYAGDDLADEMNRVARSARRRAEQLTQRAFITQIWDLYLDQFPSMIELRRVPVQEVLSITFIDAEDTERLLDAANYVVDSISEPARIMCAYGATWPTVRHQVNAVRVRFRAGYGDDPEDVPEEARDLIMLLAEQMFYGAEADARLAQAIESLVYELSWSGKV